MTLRHATNSDGTLLTYEVKPKPETNLSSDEILRKCRLAKENGMSSRLTLPISILETLASKAKAFDALSEIEQGAARRRVLSSGLQG